MWNKIKRWFWRHGIIKCKHDWVQAREFYREYEGQDYDYLEPRPMMYHPDWQANIYVCRKCYDYITTIEKIENGDNSIQQD